MGTPRPLYPLEIELLKLAKEKKESPEQFEACLAQFKRVREILRKAQGDLQLCEQKSIAESLEGALPNINACDSSSHTALIHAALLGHEFYISKLIANGADPNLKLKCGNTALMYAARKGKESCLRLLIEAKADITAEVPRWKQTPLIFAAGRGHLQCIRALIKAGAPIDHKDHKNETAFLWAVYNNQESCAHLLLAAGANIEEKDQYNETALQRATKEKQLNLISLLLQHGAIISNLTALKNILLENKEKEPVARFCLGMLSERENKTEDAKKHYHSASSYTPAHYRLGLLAESEGDTQIAILAYVMMMQENDYFGPKELVSLAQKSKSSSEKKSTPSSRDKDIELQPIPIKKEALTELLLHYLSTIPLTAHLTTTQWCFLVIENMYNPELNLSEQYHYALRAIGEATLVAKKPAEKLETKKTLATVTENFLSKSSQADVISLIGGFFDRDSEIKMINETTHTLTEIWGQVYQPL